MSRACSWRCFRTAPRVGRWLRDRRVEIGQRRAAGRSWLSDDQRQFVRLLGKQPIEANIDPALNAIFQAWDRMTPGSGRSL